jgi:hypothetical protein
MTDRPTPEQIINDIMVDALNEHGYVIVHPDDFPTAQFASAGDMTRDETLNPTTALVDAIGALTDAVLLLVEQNTKP